MYNKCIKCGTNCVDSYCPPCKMVMTLLKMYPLETYDNLAKTIQGYYGSMSFVRIDDETELLLIAIPLGEVPSKDVKNKIRNLSKSPFNEEIEEILKKI